MNNQSGCHHHDEPEKGSLNHGLFAIAAEIHKLAESNSFHAQILSLLDSLNTKVDKIMAKQDELDALLQQIDDRTNELAADSAAQSASIVAISDKLTALIAQLSTGMSQSEVDAMKAKVQAQVTALAAVKTNEDSQATTLTALASDPANPVPA